MIFKDVIPLEIIPRPASSCGARAPVRGNSRGDRNTPHRFLTGFIGQTRWQAYFSSLVKEQRCAHGYLFSGPRHVGKRTFINILSRALLCGQLADGSACAKCASCLSWRAGGHPDLMRLKLASSDLSIGIAEVREFIVDIQRTPLTAGRRVAIIEDLDRMTNEGFNALLKTLEEPPTRAILFLIAESAESLPLTVRSRLQHCFFSPLARLELAKAFVDRGLTHAEANELAALSNGCAGLIFQWREKPAELQLYQAAASRFLDLYEGSLNDKFRFSEEVLQNDNLSLLDLQALLARWRLVVRDFLYLHLNEPALIAHVFLRSRLDKILSQKKQMNWLFVYEAIERTEQMLGRNANRRLALNNLFLTI